MELVLKYAGLISTTFRVSSEEPLTSYLGFDIRLDLAAHRVYLCMSRFMEKAFLRFKMVPKQSVQTPLQENFQASLEAVEQDGYEADARYIEDFEYRENFSI